jgi:hypothetical protein
MQVARTVPQTMDAAPGASTPERYPALDAFHGFIMPILASEGFGLAGLPQRNPASEPIARQFEHMPWERISLWDTRQARVPAPHNLPALYKILIVTK